MMVLCCIMAIISLVGCVIAFLQSTSTMIDVMSIISGVYNFFLWIVLYHLQASQEDLAEEVEELHSKAKIL